MTKKEAALPESFEEGLKELEQIVRRMESGGQELEKAIADYERGMALKTLCEKRLQEAKLKVEKVVKANADGSVATEPFSEK